MKNKVHNILSKYQLSITKCAIIVFAFILFAPIVSCNQKSPYNHGKILYKNFCENCHMEDGSGLAEVIPPLAGSDFLLKHSNELPCIIKKGVKGEMTVNGKLYNTEMPGAPRLTEFEITNVINYINTAWGNNNPITKHIPVREALTKCE